MKALKLSFVAIAYLIVGGFAPRPLTTSTYYYITGTDNQRLQPGHTTESDLCQRTITQANFTDTSNWTQITQTFTPIVDYSQYIGSITFNEEFVEDGGSDGQLTLPEALSAVYAYYLSQSPNAMAAVIVVGNAEITITAATSCH
jgi:hypothetical protein